MKDAASPSAVDLAPPANAVLAAAIGDDRDVDAAAIRSGGPPPWQRDALAVSARVRALVATLRPIVVRALTFWDHAIRSVRIGSQKIEVDPSGSYRRSTSPR